MPRLTFTSYSAHRDQLRVSWLHFEGAPFAPLALIEQLRLWTYYAPTLDLSPDELREHRRNVTAQYKLLPQRAGRAYQRVLPYLEQPPVPEPVKTKRRGRGATVVSRGVPRVEVDSVLLGRAIAGMVESKADRAVSAAAARPELHSSSKQRSAK